VVDAIELQEAGAQELKTSVAAAGFARRAERSKSCAFPELDADSNGALRKVDIPFWGHAILCPQDVALDRSPFLSRPTI
jgi:hypothetical protein